MHDCPCCARNSSKRDVSSGSFFLSGTFPDTFLSFLFLSCLFSFLSILSFTRLFFYSRSLSMSIAGTTPTGSTNKHNGNNSGNLHIGISYRNAPTHSSHPLKHQAPQSLYHHCQTIYNQPLRASWISPDDDDEDDDEDEVDTESGSETPPIKDNAAAVVGRYEALLDDEAITKSYLDPPCISSPPITTTTTLEKTKTSKLSQMKGRIQSTPFPVSATTTTITKSNKEDQGVNKDTLLTRTVEKDAAIASRPSLSPLPTPPPSTTPRSPLPIGGSSSCSLNSRSSLAQRNMIMRTGSLSSLSYHHQQPISSVLSSTSTCSSSSVSSDPLFSAGTGSSSNSSNGETNDSCSPVPSSSSRLKLAFQKLRGRHFSSSTNNNEPKGPSLSDKSTSRKSTCSTITTKSSPTGPTPTKSTSLAKRIRSKFNKSKSTTTTTTTTNKRVSRATSLSSVTTWSYPEQQEQSHSFNRGKSCMKDDS